MVSFSKALKLPFTNGKKFLLGCLMYVVPFLSIITGMFALGWGLELSRNTMKGAFQLPEWRNWGRLFVEGLLGAIIALIWFIPAVVIAIILIGGALAAAATGEPAAIAGAGIGTFVVFIMFLITSYFVPGALVNYASAGEFAAGFKIRAIVKQEFTSKYFAAWILALLAYLVLNVIFGLLSALLAQIGMVGVVITFIIAALVAYIGLVISFALYGEAWGSNNYVGKPSVEYASITPKNRKKR